MEWLFWLSKHSEFHVQSKASLWGTTRQQDLEVAMKKNKI